MDARKAPLTEQQALELLREADEIYASKGKQVVHVDLRMGKSDKASLAALLLGPTGNLWVPMVRKGRTLIVGFDEATYVKLFG